MQEDIRRIRVLIETDERCFKGKVCKPARGADYRLSDHLNDYGKQFLCLTDVEIADRGREYRVGERRDFVAISIPSITYVMPLEDDREAV